MLELCAKPFSVLTYAIPFPKLLYSTLSITLPLLFASNIVIIAIINIASVDNKIIYFLNTKNNIYI